MKISNMRLLRMMGGVKLKDLASRLGVTTSYLSKVERGLEKPASDLLQKIAKILNSKTKDIL